MHAGLAHFQPPKAVKLHLAAHISNQYRQVSADAIPFSLQRRDLAFHGVQFVTQCVQAVSGRCSGAHVVCSMFVHVEECL
jgi:hypothetical protein